MPLNTPVDARLLADVGGTHARFAWQTHALAPLDHICVLRCAEHASLSAALHSYLSSLGMGTPIRAVVAIATAITGDRVSMTNHHWAFSQAELKAEFGFQTLRVLNDFTALALSLPALPPSELRQVGGGAPQLESAMGLVGAGTGLGVSGLVPNGSGGWIPLQGEGGHVTLPATTAREQTVMQGLFRRYGHASAERVASGIGLVDACRLLCEADGADAAWATDAARVSEAALTGGHPQALEALNMFCAMLGSVAGNLALTLGARGGVYVGGGIVPKLGPWFDQSPFRERFEQKGRFSAYLAEVPVWVITSAHSPALLGASRALADQ